MYFNLQKTTKSEAGANCSHMTPALTDHRQSQSHTGDAPRELIEGSPIWDWYEPWKGKT